MSSPYVETTRVETGYAIGEPAEVTHVVRTLDLDGKSPDEAAEALRWAAQGLRNPVVEVFCPCDRINEPTVTVSGTL